MFIRYASVALAISFGTSGLLAEAPLPGSNATPQMLGSVRLDLQRKYYQNCKTINILELVDLQPPNMKGKPVFKPGDKWSEKWKVNACGATAVHPINFELIAVKGQTALSQEVLPAVSPSPAPVAIRFAGATWKVSNLRQGAFGSMREFTTNGESVVAWTRLLTIVESNAPISPGASLAQLRKKFLSEGCPSADFRTLSEKSDEVIYFRGYSHCTPPDQEFNVVRSATLGGKNVTVIYAIRKSPSDEEIKQIANELSMMALDQ